MEKNPWINVAGILLLCFSLANGYSKYGRSCKDIGCRSNEVCVMAEDPCSLYQRTECGRYPTCTRSSDSGGLSCTKMVCPSGQYCKTVNGQPSCVNTLPGLDFESAGVSSINGQRTNSDSNNHDQDHNSGGNNVNPYANANAPPPEHHDPRTNYHPVNSGSGLGYPAYPSNTGSNYGGHQPSNSETNLGYPPYPTQNRMPQPGVYGQPNHPINNGGYPPYPNNQQPVYPNIPHQNQNYNHNVRRPYHNSAFINSPSLSLGLGFTFLLITKYLS